MITYLLNQKPRLFQKGAKFETTDPNKETTPQMEKEELNEKKAIEEYAKEFAKIQRVRAIQRKLGVVDDGVWGKETEGAWQRRLIQSKRALSPVELWQPKERIETPERVIKTTRFVTKPSIKNIN